VDLKQVAHITTTTTDVAFNWTYSTISLNFVTGAWKCSNLHTKKRVWRNSANQEQNLEKQADQELLPYTNNYRKYDKNCSIMSPKQRNSRRR